MRDRGSGLVLTILVTTALCSAVATTLVAVIDDLGDHQRAQAAADAAALAGVTGGRAASAAIAAANQATLMAWNSDGRRVTVTVAVDGHSATARATDE